MSEAIVRDALRRDRLAATFGAKDTIDEFWVPCTNERADLAVIGRSMDGFEIKTERDTLRRLPRQVEAYGRVFDRCVLVVAEKHVSGATGLIPDWWGLSAVAVNGSVTFSELRRPTTNRDVDPEVLVRLLWRDEAASALASRGVEFDLRASRNSLWQSLLHLLTLNELRQAVRQALLVRDSASARIRTRRFVPTDTALATGL